MTYTESIKFLFDLQKFGIKFGLEGIRSLMNSLDHPERKFRSIHIAGTNGKGSTASMIAAIFTAAGYKTGLYTSPHLVHFNERIRINGKPISSRKVAELATVVRPEVERKKITFFEAVTAMAFLYFADSNIDIAIIETGLGGRLDATNVLDPLVSVITTIGKEHTHILGSHIADIAREKGGIIKQSVPCVIGVKSPAAIQVLKNIALQQKSQLLQIPLRGICVRRSSLDGIFIDVKTSGYEIKNVRVSLAGEHQATNASLAIAAARLAATRSDYKINEPAIRMGLKNIKRYTVLQARLSIIRKKPLILADVAHNPDAVHVLVSTIRRLRLGKVHVVFGLMQDKNYKPIISSLKRIAKDIFVVEARTDRSRSSVELAKKIRQTGIAAKEFFDVTSGLKEALQNRDNDPILITGSHFVVGEALAFFNKEKYLTINQ